MLRHRLVPTLVLLLVLATPSFGAAATVTGSRSDEPDGRLVAALSELRNLLAALWMQPAAPGTVSAAAESGGSGGAGGTGGEGQSGYDPNGTQEDPGPADGLQTQSNDAAG